MEFPDTYAAVEYTKQQCAEDGTPFYTARSHFDQHDSFNRSGKAKVFKVVQAGFQKIGILRSLSGL